MLTVIGRGLDEKPRAHHGYPQYDDKVLTLKLCYYYIQVFIRDQILFFGIRLLLTKNIPKA